MLKQVMIGIGIMAILAAINAFAVQPILQNIEYNAQLEAIGLIEVSDFSTTEEIAEVQHINSKYSTKLYSPYVIGYEIPGTAEYTVPIYASNDVLNIYPMHFSNNIFVVEDGTGDGGDVSFKINGYEEWNALSADVVADGVLFSPTGGSQNFPYMVESKDPSIVVAVLMDGLNLGETLLTPYITGRDSYTGLASASPVASNEELLNALVGDDSKPLAITLVNYEAYKNSLDAKIYSKLEDFHVFRVTSKLSRTAIGTIVDDKIATTGTLLHKTVLDAVDEIPVGTLLIVPISPKDIIQNSNNQYAISSFRK